MVQYKHILLDTLPDRVCHTSTVISDLDVLYDSFTMSVTLLTMLELL